jgi:ABC-type antimicrobial peptide transport system permease subunit
MGAGVGRIAAMIALEFFWLILISMALAFPVAYYLMREWLQNFVYRAPLEPLLFFVTGIFIILVAMLTISYHTYRAGRLNPVDSIRQE